jgi:hypothetical protein
LLSFQAIIMLGLLTFGASRGPVWWQHHFNRDSSMNYDIPVPVPVNESEVLSLAVLRDVRARFNESSALYRAGVATFDPTSLLPGLVTTLIDLAVKFAGSPVARWTQAHRDQIRTYLSDAAFQFLQTTIAELK